MSSRERKKEWEVKDSDNIRQEADSLEATGVFDA